MPTKTKATAAAETIEDQAEYQGPGEVLEDSGDWEPNEDDTDSSKPDAADGSPESSAPASEQPARLAGAELLAFYDEKKQAGRSHAQIAYAAGYYTVTKDGRERVMQAQFNEALLEAQGIETGSKSAGNDRGHAGLTKARVSGQGILLVSQLATRHIGATPGTVFSVEYPGSGQILLTMTDEFKPVVARKKAEQEQPGTPLLDSAQQPA